MYFGTVYGLVESAFKRLSKYGASFNISYGQALFFDIREAKALHAGIIQSTFQTGYIQRPVKRENEGQKMIGLLLTGHDQFAGGLLSAINMVAGSQPHIKVLSFEDRHAATYPAKLNAAIGSLRAESNGVIVLTDFMGGTPWNQAMIATQDYSDVAVIAGANVPMLLDTLDYLESDYTLDDMVEELIAAGKDGVMYRHLPRLRAVEYEDPSEKGEGI